MKPPFGGILRRFATTTENDETVASVAGAVVHFCFSAFCGEAPVAQLDRASDYGSEGLRFESSRVRFSG